jgi:hypothetical protein
MPDDSAVKTEHSGYHRLEWSSCWMLVRLYDPGCSPHPMPLLREGQNSNCLAKTGGIEQVRCDGGGAQLGTGTRQKVEE